MYFGITVGYDFIADVWQKRDF